MVSSSKGRRPSRATISASRDSRPGGRGLGGRRRPRQAVLLDLEAAVLVGVVDPGVVQLADLEAQEVGFPGAGAAIATERRELRVDLGDHRPGVGHRPEVDAGEAVERRSLHRSGEQRLVRVLAVQVHQSLPELGERRRGREVAVDVRPGAALPGHDAPQHRLGSVEHEPTLHHGLVTTGTDP